MGSVRYPDLIVQSILLQPHNHTPSEEDSALAVLHAAIERIIPPDDFSGAREAGAGAYIRRQLAGNWRHGWQPRLRAVLQLAKEDR
jgi:hypothetical protein